MADFLVLAAKLLLIKSKALLPYLYPEEEEDIEELEAQLRMYKEFIEATKLIEKMIGKKKFMFAREFNRKAVLANVNIFSPPKKLKKNDLKEVFQDLIIRIKPAEEELEKGLIEDKINIEDKIKSIHSMLLKRIKISFNSILSGSKNKTEIIVNFLAMLELIKQRDAVAEQGELFGDIEINNAR
jgi:segregation and condensation protein A